MNVFAVLLSPLIGASRWLSHRCHGSANFVAGACGRRSRPSQVLVVTILLLACWQDAHAELVFHRRDHRDQGRGTRTNRRSQDVQNPKDALLYLQKYGYLEHCRTTSGRQRRHLPDFLPDVAERLPDCSAAMIAEALKLLQQKFDLRPSGRLDNETRALMSRGRCGNSDASASEALPRERRDARSHLGIQRQERGNEYGRRLLGEIVAGGNAVRRRRSAGLEVATMTTVALVTEDIVERQAHAHGRVFNAGHVTVLEADQSESSRLRREKMLQHIAANHRETASSSPHPHQQNLTEDSLAAVLQARLMNRAQRQPRPRRRRRKRTISVLSIGEMSEGPAGDRVKFQKDEIQWRLLDDGISGKIPLADQRAILELSFRMWSEVIPLKFQEANEIDINDVDVIIAFAKQNHMNCDKPFDGVGGELAHSWTRGDIHFDEDENYKRVDPSGAGIDLLKVAVHEVGHVLGLLHNDKINSIMYPIYVNKRDMYDDFELSWEDRKAVQKIYGVCKGSFDVVFDWLRKVRSTAEPHQRPRYIFNTYFFRTNRYWMYENRFNRTRFGDPLHISRGWTGIAGHVDAYTQVITLDGQEYNIDTYFFVGDSYYKYNDEVDRVEEGYPRKISDDFGAKSADHEAIPDNIDAVLFDNRDSLLYFFKDDWVWTYDPRQIGRNACCESKRLFTEVYPMDTTTTADDQLTGQLDTVFYSYHFHTTYFFRGETVYENVAYNEKTPGANRLRRLGAWYHFWFDICDVE